MKMKWKHPYLKVTYRLLSCKHNGPWGRSRFEVACVIYHKMCSLLSFWLKTEMLLKNFVYEDPYVTSEIHCPHLVLMHVNLANISRGHDFFFKQQIVSNSTWKVRG